MASPASPHNPSHILSSEPTPPQEDSMVDPDLSPSRKRPRLDSGSRTMSADRIRSPASLITGDGDAPSSTDNLENQREQSPTRDHVPSLETSSGHIIVARHSSNKENMAQVAPSSSCPSPSLNSMTEHIQLNGNGPESPSTMQQSTYTDATAGDSSSGESPRIEVVMDDSEDAANTRTDSVLTLEEDATVELLRTFPYSKSRNGHLKAALELADHFRTSRSPNYDTLIELDSWLTRHIQHSQKDIKEWSELYSTTSELWEHLAALLLQLLSRELPLQPQWTAQRIGTLVASLIACFAEIFSRLLRLDIQKVSSLPSQASEPPILLSAPFFPVFNQALRPRQEDISSWRGSMYTAQKQIDVEEAPIWSNLPSQAISIHIAQAFLRPNSNGVEYLTQLALTLLKNIYHLANVREPLKHCLCIMQHLVSIQLVFNHDKGLKEIDTDVWTSIAPNACSLFESVSAELYASIEKPASLPNLDAELAKDLVRCSQYLPVLLARLDPQLSKTLFNKVIGSSAVPENFDKDLLQCVWMLRLLKCFIRKGRMDMRIAGLELMNQELVSIWNRYDTDSSNESLKYVAQTIIDERLLDYMVGSDSHPQLISRSGNIVGFLAVTRVYTTAHTDLFWNTINNHPDPRMVAATLVMLQSMLQYLTLPNILHLCKKLQLEAVERSAVEGRALTDSLLNEAVQRLAAEPWDALTSTIPCLVGLRILREAFSPHNQGSRELINFGLDVFTFTYSRLTKSEDRLSLLQNCIKDVKAGAWSANGSTFAVLKTLLGPNDVESLSYLTDHLNAPLILIQRICQLVKPEDSAHSGPLFGFVLKTHLSLLHRFLVERPDSIPADLDATIWDHLVGFMAASSHLRDIAWECFQVTAERSSEPNPFIERGLTQQVPRLHSESFTPYSYHFLEAAVKYQARFHPQECTPLSESVHVPLGDQLWNCILTVSQNSIEDETINLFVSLHLEPEQSQDAIRPILESTHVALVRKCIKELTHDFTRLKSSDGVEENEGPEMSVDMGDGEVQTTRLRFLRIMRLLTFMLQRIRANKDLSPTPTRSSPKLKKRNPAETNSERIIIKYQTFDGNCQSMIKSFVVCGQDNLAELRRNLSDLSGFPYYKLICGGQHIDLEKDRDMTIGESGIASRGLLMIIKKANSQISQSSSVATVGGSAFERELLKHFNDLYDFMDSDDDLSYAVLDFLRHFKPEGKPLQLISSETTTPTEIFPPGKTCKIQFLLRCLRLHLSEQVQQDSTDRSFVFRSIRLLDSAFLQGAFFGHSSETPAQWRLVTDAVDCFCELLKALTVYADHQAPFSDPPALLNCFLRILWKVEALKSTEFDGGLLAVRTFYLIFQAAIHNEAMWNGFRQRSDFLELHKTFLLLHDDQKTRRNLAAMIGWLVETSYPTTFLTHALVSAAYLPILNLVPEAVQQKDKAKEFFDAAVVIFRASYVTGVFVEDALLSYFSDWSGLLLSLCGQPRPQLCVSASPWLVTDGDECVSRDMVHEGLLGLTKLLKTCVWCLDLKTSPKSWFHFLESSQEARTLVKEIISNLLFPCIRDTTSDDVSGEEIVKSTASDIPILDEQTRQELHELGVMLCPDAETLQIIIEMVLKAVDQGNAGDPLPWQVDRSQHIRSTTGYVGISNLSNTCYMNSLLSQLFMNVDFRRFILSASIASPADQPLLVAAQKLFANMQDSYAKYASSSDFANAVLGVDGKSIDVSVQMDVDEFFAQLFDLWESQLLSDRDKDNFRKFYGGTYVTQIRPSDCSHVSEKIENFNALQLEVRGKSTLEESLKAYVEGDVMEGENKYKCTQCDGGRYSNYAVKRSCLKEIPDSLILHLKRFDYDLISFSRHKVDDQFEFPDRIDMSPYKLDHIINPQISREPDIFELVGILVHDGTAEAGHYYSFIRERPAPAGERPKWFKFNDVLVTDFNPGQIGISCFGGDKRFSAYMLFYDRASKLEISGNTSSKDVQLATPTKVPVPLPILSEITSANRIHLLRYCLFDPDFPPFVLNLVEKGQNLTQKERTKSPEIESASMELLFKTLDHVVARTKEYPQVDFTVNALVKWIDTDKYLAWKALVFLGQNADIAVNLMIRTPSKHRYFIKERFEFVLATLRAEDPSLYGIERNPDSQDSNSFDFHIDGALPKFIIGLKGQLSYLSPLDRVWEDYFGLLLGLATLGEFETGVLLNSGFLEACLGILLCDVDDELGSSFTNAQRFVLRAHSRTPPFKHLMMLLYRLFSFIDLNARIVENNEERMMNYNSNSKRFALTKDEDALLGVHQRKEGLSFLYRIFVWNDWTTAPDGPHIPLGIFWLVSEHIAPDRKWLGRLFQTLNQLLGATESDIHEHVLKAAIGFCQLCPRQDLVEELISRIAHRSKHLDGRMGRAYLSFFDDLTRLTNRRIDAAARLEVLDQEQTQLLEETSSTPDLPDLKPETGNDQDSDWRGPFYGAVIYAAPVWGHALLQYETSKTVREQAATLIEALIISNDPGSTSSGRSTFSSSRRNDSSSETDKQDQPAAETDVGDKTEPVKAKHLDILRTRAIRTLFYNGLVCCRNAQQSQMNKAFFLPMLDIVDKCSTWIRKLLQADGDGAEYLRSQGGIQLGDVWCGDGEMCRWWRKFVPIARDIWPVEEMAEYSDADDMEDEDSDLHPDEP